MRTVWSNTDKPRVNAKEKKNDASLVARISGWVDDSRNWVSAWEYNQEKWHRLRMRIKKTKSFPFVGCANIRMPTVETKIRKLKSALMNVLTGIRPIVQVVPTPSGNWVGALKIEKFLDHLLMEVMNIKNKLIITVDQALEKGFYVVKPYWKIEVINRVETIKLSDMSVEEAQWIFDPNRRPEELGSAVAKKFDVDTSPRVVDENRTAIDNAVQKILSGEKEVDLTVQDVICDYPDIALCPKIFVPTTTGYNPQDAQYIVHEFYIPLQELKSNVEYKGWKDISAKEIEAKGNIDLEGLGNELEVTKDEREGITRLQSEGNLVKIHECFCYYDINNDGVEEKCIVTIAPEFGKLLRKISLPYYSGKFPFVKFFYELTEDRWFSHRGIPEIIEDIVKEIDMQHMQKLDYGTMANSPLFVYRAGMINKNATQFLFGQGVPVHGMSPLNDTFAPLNKQNPNIEFSYEREEMLLNAKVEELIGQVDFTLQSMINKRQPRTLGEVQLQNQNMQQVFSLDADLFRGQFEELVNWVWDLWCQYGDENYEFMYFGQSSQGQSIKMSKEELQGKYRITIRGNDQNTNPQVRLQKAQQILMAAQNPMMLQVGVITPANIYSSMARFYQELEIPNWEELISQPQPPQPPPPNVKIGMEDMTDAEAAQVLAKQGIQPDMQGRSLKSQAIVQEKHAKQKLENIQALHEVHSMISEGEQNQNKMEKERDGK
jgi:hypothetical protein